MTERLLLDEHYSDEIARALCDHGYDVLAVVALPDLRGKSDDVVFEYGARNGYRIVTENIKDFRPLLLVGPPKAQVAKLLLVPAKRFHRGDKNSNQVIIAALLTWLEQAETRPVEDWLRGGLAH